MSRISRLSKVLSITAAALLVISFVAFVGVRVTLAHEQRTIAGKYDVEVGWDKEPAIAGQMNAATIQIYKTGTQTPIENVDKTLKVKIASGGNEGKTFDLHSIEERKGYYLADLIPTKTGSYIFTFVGNIEDTAVSEKFESGPNRFDDVTPADTLQFPQTEPDPLALASDIKAARDDINSARTLGIVGVVIGIVGVVVGGAALATRRR